MNEFDVSQIPSDEERHRKFLTILNRGWLGVGFMAVISLFFYPEDIIFLSSIIVFTLLTFLIIHLLMQYHKMQFAKYFFVIAADVFTYTFFLIMASQIGVSEAISTEAPILMWMGLAIIFAGSLINRWAAIYVAAVNSLVLLLTVVLLAPGSDPRISIHVFWWLLALSVWLYENMLYNAFAQLKNVVSQQEKIVSERTQALQKSVNELENFAYSISHDLRAPLRAINSFSKILDDEYSNNLQAEAADYLKRITQSSLQLNTLIDDLLKFTRLSRQEFSKEMIKTASMVNQIIAELQESISERKIHWQVDCLPDCHGNSSLIRQVWRNLLQNALKYTRKQDYSRIEIGYTVNDTSTTYFVRDNGVGFDMRYTDKLFQIFQRLHQTQEFEGTGIGLAVVKQIVERHGGNVWAEGEINKGATFYFSLPKKQSGY